MKPLPPPTTRIEAAEMALRSIELDRDARRFGAITSRTGGKTVMDLIGEADALRLACQRYLEDVEGGAVKIGHKAPDQYAMDACVLLNASVALGHPPDALELAANSAALALSTLKRKR